MNTGKTASQVRRKINKSVSGEGADYWDGCSQEVIDEIVILGQHQGVEAAVAEIYELAKRPVSKTDH